MPIFKINLGLNYSIWNVSVILSWKKKTIKPNMINFLDFKRRSIETVPTLLITVKIITNTPQPLLSGHLYTAISIRWPNKIKLKMVAFLLFSFLLSLVLICRRYMGHSRRHGLGHCYGICEHSSPNHNLSSTSQASQRLLVGDCWRWK